MRRIAKVDTNQAEIVAAMRRVGYSVCDLSRVGGGVPDLLIAGVDRTTGRSVNLLMECKTATGNLNALQRAWHAEWRGPLVVVRSVDEALKAVGVLR